LDNLAKNPSENDELASDNFGVGDNFSSTEFPNFRSVQNSRQVPEVDLFLTDDFQNSEIKSLQETDFHHQNSGTSFLEHQYSETKSRKKTPLPFQNSGFLEETSGENSETELQSDHFFETELQYCNLETSFLDGKF